MRRDADRLADILEAAAKLQQPVARGRARFDIDLDVVWSAAANEVPELARRIGEITAVLASEDKD